MTTRIFKQLDTTFYRVNGVNHREDGPAVINSYMEEWWINGQRHREDGPAIVSIGGSVSYYVRGKLHRKDGPAIILTNGLQEWWEDGRRHRVDGPASVFGENKEWWVNGELHRTDGPAIVGPSRSEWYEKGKLHRLDGPAVQFHHSDINVWYLDGVRYTEEEFVNAKKMLKDEIVDILYNDVKMCKDIAQYISCFVY